MEKINLADALLYSLIGIAIVFAVLLVLIIVISVMSVLLKNKKPAKTVQVNELPAEANGSLGEVSRFDVPDRTAAMIMAIVADKTGIPLNRLRFKSIKEIKDGDGEK
ncbi:MAG: OadG family protein [Clostridia bacterium]|nr:OadG family protein [Clostridia bacterium]